MGFLVHGPPEMIDLFCYGQMSRSSPPRSKNNRMSENYEDYKKRQAMNDTISLPGKHHAIAMQNVRSICQGENLLQKAPENVQQGHRW
jgi:hypothetical protein